MIAFILISTAILIVILNTLIYVLVEGLTEQYYDRWNLFHIVMICASGFLLLTGLIIAFR